MVGLGCLIFLKSVYLFREGEKRESKGGQRERRRERIPSRVCAVSSESDPGLDVLRFQMLPRVRRVPKEHGRGRHY